MRENIRLLYTRARLILMAVVLSAASLFPLSKSVSAATSEKLLFRHAGYISSINLDGTEETPLIQGAISPSVSPDGKTIYYAASIGSSYDISAYKSDGTVQNLTSTEYRYETDPVASPDGQHIMYYLGSDSGLNGTEGLAIMNVDGSNKHLLVPGGYPGSFSPDGSKIVYTDPSSGSMKIINIDGSNPVSVASAAYSPSWSPSGEYIAFLSPSDFGGDDHVKIVKPDGTGLQNVIENIHNQGGLNFTDLNWTADSSALIVVRGPYEAISTISLTGQNVHDIIVADNPDNYVTEPTNAVYLDDAFPKLDITPPTIGSIEPSTITKPRNRTANFSVSASDTETGISGGEFYISDDVDFYSDTYPMTYSNGTLSGHIGTDLPMGTYTLYAHAFDNAYPNDNTGNVSQDATAILIVTEDSTSSDETAPIVEAVTNPPANTYGWNNSPVTVNWSVSDDESAITDTQGCGTLAINTDSNAHTLSCTATSEGGTTTETITVKLDQAAPTVSTPSWSQNPKPTNGTTTLTAHALDGLSGVSKAEYFIGDTDPGQGNGATMTLTNQQSDGSADLTTTFGTDFPTGVYKISVRAQDVAGNWSEPVSDYLVVYDVNGPTFKGKRTVVPSLSNGDVLPGLISTSQTDKAKFGFVVKYNNQGQISNNSDLQFSYSTGTHCNNPNNAQNCHDMALNAAQVSWLTTQGTNNSTGIFQGTATLTVDGQNSNILFRVTGRDGERLNPTATDQFQLQIFNITDNPNTATPIYKINSTDIARGNIKIINN